MAARDALALPEQSDGLALADSLSLDAHKWLYQPIDCGCLLYREARFAPKAFSNSDDYVWIFSETRSNPSLSSSCHTDFRAIKLWMSLQYRGHRAYREAIERDLAHGRLLAENPLGRPLARCLSIN